MKAVKWRSTGCQVLSGWRWKATPAVEAVEAVEAVRAVVPVLAVRAVLPMEAVQAVLLVLEPTTGVTSTRGCLPSWSAVA
jgi:hypothetical protein